MINREADFFSTSRSLVEDFLQSTVIIDDYEPGRQTQRPDSNLQTPTPRRRPQAHGGDVTQEDERPQAEDVRVLGVEMESHYFDPKLVIDGFAKKHIVCSVIRPDRDDMNELVDLIVDLADCADITVLDWSLHNDEGDKVKEILAEIYDPARDPISDRLRLIAIYTGSTEYTTISRQIKEFLESKFDIAITEDTEHNALLIESTRIVVLAKPSANLLQEHEGAKVPFECLVEKLIDEFAVMTAGLVSNVAIGSFSAIRNNTFRVLKRFSKNLDPPYLAHRFMLSEPQAAEDHLEALIAEELQALFEEVAVGQNASMSKIKEWLLANSVGEISYGGPSNSSVDNTCMILENGFQQYLDTNHSDWANKKKNKFERNLHRQPLSQQFAASDGTVQHDEHFAYVASMRAHYSNSVPALTLGAILKDETEDGAPYLLCIQPRCDCIRLTGERNFPFLPLEPNNGRFDAVVREGDNYSRLITRKNPYRLYLLRFVPRSEGLIKAEPRDGHFYFQDTGGTSYRWMGDLRSDHALRVSNQFASTIGRVGLDESEWLRRWAKP